MNRLEQWQIEKLEAIEGWKELCEDTPAERKQRKEALAANVGRCKKPSLMRLCTILQIPKSHRVDGLKKKQSLTASEMTTAILRDIDRRWMASVCKAYDQSLIKCENLIANQPKGYIKDEEVKSVMKLVRVESHFVDKMPVYKINGMGRDCEITDIKDGHVEFVKIMYGGNVSGRKPRIYRGRIISEDATGIVYEPITKCK